jgi:hypothetical protein
VLIAVSHFHTDTAIALVVVLAGLTQFHDVRDADENGVDRRRGSLTTESVRTFFDAFLRADVPLIRPHTKSGMAIRVACARGSKFARLWGGTTLVFADWAPILWCIRCTDFAINRVGRNIAVAMLTVHHRVGGTVI